MTAPSGILDFFVLEASEYIEQLDGLMVSGGSAGPNAEAFQRASRALRGSATMARLSAFADLAAALERAARSLREGTLRWSPGLSGAIVGAVDDLKILVRAARAWGDSESRRASARAAEISGFLPADRPASPSPSASQTGPAFLAAETANIAAGLELVLTGPPDSSAPGNVIRRLRALRGIAAIRDVPPLAEILEAADEASRPLEAGSQLPPENRELLEAAGVLLREAAKVLRGQGAAASPGPLTLPADATSRFEAALGRLTDADASRGKVVPVSKLFFDDGGPHVVTASQQPPTTRADRFRLELVGHGEHLRRLVGETRAASETGGTDRSRRALRRALISVRHTAESFGEDSIAETVSSFADSLSTIDAPALTVLTGLADLLSSPGQDSDRLRAELPRLVAGRVERERADAIGTVAEPLPSPERSDPSGLTWIHQVAPTPAASQASAVPTPSEVRQPADPARRAFRPTPAPRPTISPDAATPTLPASPTGAGLASLLDMGIASVEELDSRPLAAAVPVEETLVPIESLVYRGEAAWRRALEVRDELRGQATPPRETLEELYDLLDLVTE